MGSGLLIGTNVFLIGRWPPSLIGAIGKNKYNTYKKNLTNDVIEQAVLELPRPSCDLRGEEIIRITKARRDGMEKYARELYELLLRKVEVVGTDKHEYSW